MTAAMPKPPAPLHRPVALALLLLAPAGAGAGPAADPLDHDHIRRLRETGAILPMAKVLEHAQAVAPGELLEAELEHRPEGYRYEVELLLPAGVIEKLWLDATTGAVLGRETEIP